MDVELSASRSLPLVESDELQSAFRIHRDGSSPCAASPQVLLGAGAAPRLDARVVFRSHSSDRDRHPLPAARPKGDVLGYANKYRCLSERTSG